MLSYSKMIPRSNGTIGMGEIEVPHPFPRMQDLMGGAPKAKNLNGLARSCCAIGSTLVLAGTGAMVLTATSDLPPTTKYAIYAVSGASILATCICFRLASTYKNARNAIDLYLAPGGIFQNGGYSAFSPMDDDGFALGL